MALGNWNPAVNEGDAAYAHELQGPESEGVYALRVPRYWLKPSYDRALHVSTLKLLVKTHEGKADNDAYELVSEVIVEGNINYDSDVLSEAVRALRETRHHASAWGRARRRRELQTRGELNRRVPTWVG